MKMQVVSREADSYFHGFIVKYRFNGKFAWLFNISIILSIRVKSSIY